MTWKRFFKWLLIGGVLAVFMLVGIVLAALRDPLTVTSVTSGLFTRSWSPDLVREEVALPIGDEQLHGWYLSGRPNKEALLYLHGAGGNITGRVGTLRMMNQILGVSVFIFDYRGYGKSTGACDLESLMVDARAARRWLAERSGRPEGEIVLYGHSLGSMVAARLAAEDGARGLVMTGTPPTVSGLLAYKSGVPAGFFEFWLDWPLNPIDHIGGYDGPLMLMAGEGDSTWESRLIMDLYEQANEPKSMVILPGVGHDGIRLSPVYRPALESFLNGLGK